MVTESDTFLIILSSINLWSSQFLSALTGQSAFYLKHKHWLRLACKSSLPADRKEKSTTGRRWEVVTGVEFYTCGSGAFLESISLKRGHPQFQGAYFQISTIRARIYSAFAVAASNAIKRLRKTNQPTKKPNQYQRHLQLQADQNAQGWSRSREHPPFQLPVKTCISTFLTHWVLGWRVAQELLL